MGWIKDLFSNGKGKKEKKDEWIEAKFSLMVPFLKRNKLKEALKPEMDKLGWKIVSYDEFEERKKERENDPVNNFANQLLEKMLRESREKNGEKDVNPFENMKIENPETTTVSVNAYPEGRLTPEEFLNIKDKLVNLSYAMNRDLVHGGNDKKAKKDFRMNTNIHQQKVGDKKATKEDWTITNSIGFFSIEYPLYKRIELEKEDKEKALSIFGSIAEEEIALIFSNKPLNENKKIKIKEENKELYEYYKKMKEELKELFGFKFD